MAKRVKWVLYSNCYRIFSSHASKTGHCPLGTCFSKTAFWRQIITFSSKHFFRLFMFYKRNNQIITSKRNPKHTLKR
ncbi:hypothetical protein Hanom_Chr05g00440811 [Helianthus anomalus]